MTPERWQALKEVVAKALELPLGARSEYLGRACGDDKALRAEAESLLSQDRHDASFLNRPLIVPSQLAAGKRLLHYEIVELLGAGGMGVVYKARDPRLERFVAIKVLPCESLGDPERRRRFQREARAASALNHPNIVTVYDIGSVADCDFIVMEYIAGKPRDQMIGPGGMELKAVLMYGVQIARALEAAHSAGIIHRDLKPGNIMVSDAGAVKVVDFGLAKKSAVAEEKGNPGVASAHTVAGAVLGTAPYMSPEQAEGRPVDTRSDVFSFGTVLYEMTTGRRAFPGESRIATLTAIIGREPELIRTIAPETPTALEDLVNSCLQKNPKDRIQQMAEVKAALEQVQESMGQDFDPVRRRPAGRSVHREPLAPAYQRNREHLIKRIRNDWIKGVLNLSLYKLVQIDLGLETRPDAVDRPLNAIVYGADEKATTLPPNARIGEIFDEHGEALLILGEPGTGKTTLVLELLRDLLDSAEQDAGYPIPLVFNLSSWARKRRPLSEWLIEEMRERDYASKTLATQWVRGEHIIPLLDGLDEVSAEHRDACIEAINEFRHEHPLLPILASSRTNDYQRLHTKIRLLSAIEVQPLTEAQVESCLAVIGPAAEPVRTALQDETVAELLRTPLMLWVALLAYRHDGAGIIAPETLEDKRRRLFGKFVDVMLSKTASRQTYSAEESVRHLSWLASVLSRNNLTMFALEDLSRIVLYPRNAQRLSRTLGFLFVGLAFGISGGTPFSFGALVQPSEWAGVAYGMSFALAYGTVSQVVNLGPTDRIRIGFGGMKSQIPIALRFGISAGLSASLILVPTLVIGSGLAVFITNGFEFRLRYILMFIRLFLPKVMLFAFIWSTAIASICRFFFDGTVGARSAPNEGVRRSIIMALASGISVTVVVGGMFQIGLGRWLYSLSVGLYFGQLIAGFAGGMFALKHFAAVCALRATGVIPRRYSAFLDYACEHLLLRRVGGSYCFVHRVLLDHLARQVEREDKSQ